MSTQPSRKARKKANKQQLVVSPSVVQETGAKGKSIALALGMAPVLLPMITQAVTQVISAVKGGSPPQSSLRILGPKKAGSGGTMVRQKAGPGNNAAPGFKTGMTTLRETARGRVVVFRDEIGTVTTPAGVGVWGSAIAAGVLTYTLLSPVDAWLHPTNFAEGEFFTNWQPKAVRLSFVPTGGDQQSGTVVIGYVDSPQSAPATDAVSTEARAMALPSSRMIPANKPGVVTVGRELKSWSQEFEIGNSAAVDLKDITPGYVFCYATGISAGAVAVGKLFIECTYELMDRRPPFLGAGLTLQVYREAGMAASEKDRARVRAKLADLLDLIVSTVTDRLKPRAEDELPMLSEAELARRVSLLLAPCATAYDGGRGKPRSC